MVADFQAVAKIKTFVSLIFENVCRVNIMAGGIAIEMENMEVSIMLFYFRSCTFYL